MKYINQGGKLARERRLEMHLTQEKVADAIGVKKSTISKYELGINQSMRISNMKNLSDLLGVPVATLMGLD